METEKWNSGTDCYDSVQKFCLISKNINTHIRNNFVLVRNLISQIKERIQIKYIWEQSAEENIWAKHTVIASKLNASEKKTRVSQFALSTK
jgi:hypothetical protein